MRPTHRRAFRVRRYEIDHAGRLQAPILCRLLQETAGAHAAELGVAMETLIEGGAAWVLSRLRLEVERWPGADEEIVVTTWPEAGNRLLIDRRFEVVDASGDVLASATTLWLVLDFKRRRPIRFPAAVLDALSRHKLGAQPMKPPRLETPDPADCELVFTVRRSDLDLVDHVNNTSYVEWAIEAVPDRVWVGHELAELDISYLSECHHGQTVVSQSQTVDADGGCVVRHQIARREDGEVVARARSGWRSFI